MFIEPTPGRHRSDARHNDPGESSWRNEAVERTGVGREPPALCGDQHGRRHGQGERHDAGRSQCGPRPHPQVPRDPHDTAHDTLRARPWTTTQAYALAEDLAADRELAEYVAPEARASRLMSVFLRPGYTAPKVERAGVALAAPISGRGGEPRLVTLASGSAQTRSTGSVRVARNRGCLGGDVLTMPHRAPAPACPPRQARRPVGDRPLGPQCGVLIAPKADQAQPRWFVPRRSLDWVVLRNGHAFAARGGRCPSRRSNQRRPSSRHR
jgi:hypothetical protein